MITDSIPKIKYEDFSQENQKIIQVLRKEVIPDYFDEVYRNFSNGIIENPDNCPKPNKNFSAFCAAIFGKLDAFLWGYLTALKISDQNQAKIIEFCTQNDFWFSKETQDRFLFL